MGYSPQGLKELDSTKVTEDRARYRTFQVGLRGKESACQAGDLDSIPGSGRCPGGGNGNPLQHSCLENPHGQRNLVGYSPQGLKESDTTEQ